MAHRAGHHGHHEHQHPERIVGKYIVTQQIGSGSFAVVWKARSMETGEEVAIKEIATDKLNPKLQESLLSEIDILKCTHHPNIIRLLDMVIVSVSFHLLGAGLLVRRRCGQNSVFDFVFFITGDGYQC